MKKIRFMFKKARKDGDFLDDGISLYTKCIPINWNHGNKFDYCHVETEFVDRGLCFSSTMQEPWNGVRFAPSDEVLNDRYEGWEFEISDAAEQHLYELAEKECGKPYDVKGLTTGFFMFAAFLQDDKKRYCSDICAWLATCLGMFRKRYWIISPRRFAYLLYKRFGNPTC